LPPCAHVSFSSFFHCCGAPQVLHSFPTRRSSDLDSTEGPFLVIDPSREPRKVSLERRPRSQQREAYRFGSRYHQPSWRPSAHRPDRKSTRLNSSHVKISYAVFCLKKKKNKKRRRH